MKIEKVYIRTPGDRSVGIWPANFEATVFLEENLESKYGRNFLEGIRNQFKELYGGITGETPRVIFDFEMDKLTKEESPE